MLAGLTPTCCIRRLSTSTCGCVPRNGLHGTAFVRSTHILSEDRTAALEEPVSRTKRKKWNSRNQLSQQRPNLRTSALIDRLPPPHQEWAKSATNVTYEDVVQEAKAARITRSPAIARRDSKPSAQSQKGPLRPFELAQLVKGLADAGKLTEAIETVKGSSQASQNVVVWNLLILSAFSANHPKIAYDLFTDMKRRGFKPQPSTWTILFQGFTGISRHDSLTERSIERISSAYLGFMAHLASIRESDPDAVQTCIIPFNAYLSLLAELKRHKDLYDVFISMFDDGMPRPDRWTYTVVIQALLKRKEGLWPGEQDGPIETRNAILAQRTWDDMMTRREKDDVSIEIDSYLLGAMLRVLTASPRPSDWQFGVTIIEELLGLQKPDTLSPPRTNHPMIARGTARPPPALTPYSLHLALLLVIRMRRFRFALHYVQQIMDSPYKHLLEREHMHIVINSYAELAVERGSGHAEQALETVQWMLHPKGVGGGAPKLQPNLETFTLLLRACWKAGKYELTRRTFALMSGYNSDDFDRPGKPERSKINVFLPDTHGLACIFRCAMMTRNRRNTDHALRIMQFIGLEDVWGPKPGPHQIDGETLMMGNSRKVSVVGRVPHSPEARDTMFYRMKLAQAVLEHKDQGGAFPFDPAYEKEFLARARLAKKAFRQTWTAGWEVSEWMGESIKREHTPLQGGEDSADESEDEPTTENSGDQQPLAA